jgi:Domain of unknown function (DUF4157)
VDRTDRSDKQDQDDPSATRRQKRGGGERSEKDKDKKKLAAQVPARGQPQGASAAGPNGEEKEGAEGHGESAHQEGEDGAGEWLADESLMTAMGLEPGGGEKEDSAGGGESPAAKASGDGSVANEAEAAPAGAGGAVQMKGGGDAGSVHETAAAGISGSAGQIPHFDAISSSFGSKYDVGNIQAHTDGAAQSANQSMGSDGFATRDHVAFASAAPSLHTAAHEAAHVVQQQAGVALKGGVGSVGDQHEQHADAVADRVVQGKSATDLLDQYGGGGGNAGGAVQHQIIQFDIKADLKKAMSGWGTDEAAIFRRIENATAAEVAAVHNDPKLLAEILDELEDEPDRDRFYALSARKLYLLDATKAFRMLRGPRQAQRLAIVGPVAVQRAIFDAVVMTTSDAALGREAFHLYWTVTMGLDDAAGTGTLSWPLATLRLIHTELKKIPDQDTRSGAWTQLTLTNSASLINRAAYGGGNFLVGANASTASERVSGYGTFTTEPAPVNGRRLKVSEPGRFKTGDAIRVGLPGDPDTEDVQVRSVVGSNIRLRTPLTKAHPANTQIGAGDITGSRRVNWLRDTVRHEIGHAVESAIGGVTSFTQGIGGWWTGTSFDTWAGQMSDAWHTNNRRPIPQADKDDIKLAITNAMTNQSGTLTSLPATHAIRRLWNQNVPVIVAAERCLSQGDGFFQNPNTLYSSGGKRFSISFWYKRFQSCNDTVVADRLTDYTLYAPAEFFAENYSIFYEDAGTVPDADLGNRIRNTTWRQWIRTNIHNRGHAPAGTGGGGSGPSAEAPGEDHDDTHEGTATASGASFGRASGNPG